MSVSFLLPFVAAAASRCSRWILLIAVLAGAGLLGVSTVHAQSSNEALRFDGAGDQVVVPDAASLRPQTFTVEAWVKASSFPNYATAVMKTSSSLWTDGFGIAHYNQTNDISFFVDTWNQHFVTGTLNASGWTHVAGTYDGSTMRLYIDGVLADSVAYSGGRTASTQPLRIGNGQGGFSWHGDVDDVRLWDRARTPAEIQSSFDAPLTGNEPGLVGYWPLDGAPTDQSGSGHDGAVQGAQFVASTAPIGNAVDSSDAYAVSVGFFETVETSLTLSPAETASGVTFAAWVYPTNTSASGDWQVVSTNDGGDDWSVLHHNGEWAVMNGQGRQGTGLSVNVNEWQYVAAVFDPSSGEVRFYKNEQEVVVSDIETEADGPVHLGSDANDGSVFEGRIDQVRVWNGTRSASQIRNRYDETLRGDASGLLAYWPFEAGQGSTAPDATGNGHTATLDGATWVQPGAPVAPRSDAPPDDGNTVMQFDGDDNVAVSDDPTINRSDQAERSIAFWFRASDPSLSTRKQIIYEEGGLTNGFNLYVYADTLYAGAWSEGNDWDGHWHRTAAPAPDTWHHVALVYNHPDSTYTAYLNGAPFGRVPAPVVIKRHDGDIGIGAARDNTTFHDGAVPGSGSGFAGAIDEGRIWNTARSQAEISLRRFERLNGDEQGLVAYWPFDEGSGSTTADASGTGNDGTLNGATWAQAQLPSDGRTESLVIADGGTYTTGAIELSWSSLDAATAYRVDLATGPDASRIIRTLDAGTATSASVDASTLQDGTTYYARVRATTDEGTVVSPFTDGVTVDRSPPTVDRPVGRLTNQAQVAFSTTGSDNTGIVSFRVQVSTDVGFGTIVTDTTVSPGASVVVDATRGSTYYARATATDRVGQTSAFSAASVGIPVPELPDLTVSSVSVPSEGFSGQPIEVSWTTSNVGNASTNAPNWRDRVILSEDGTLDSDDNRLGSASNVSYLDRGDAYTGTAEVTLPRGISGAYTVFVRADGGRVLAESDETNNAASAPLIITQSPYPDLEVTDLTVPQTAFSGDSVRVTWTVTNVGTGPADVNRWQDGAVLSADSTLDFSFVRRGQESGQRISINEPVLSTVRHTGALPVDSSYTTSAKIPLPVDSVGTFTLFIYADLPGGVLTRPKIGSVYEFNQDLDNWTGDSIDVRLTPPPDLTVTSVQGPAQATSGDTVTVSWTVENQGPGPTPERSDSWNDLISYSPSPTFDSTEAEVLQAVSHTGTLASDASYTATQSVILPDGIEGDAHFFVRTDWTDDVFEHTFEGNNRSGGSPPTNVALAAYPDLQARSLRLDDTTATAGTQIESRFRIRNAGSGPAQAWTDSVYLSPSARWDPQQARAVAAVSAADPLRAGSAREQTAAVSLPSDLDAGTYYAYARADAGNRAFELPDTSGNVARSAALTVQAYPPIDLRATLSGLPSTAPAGSTLTPTLTVTNDGRGRTRTSTWRDLLVLSTDSIRDDQDLVLADLRRESRLDGGAQYTRSPDLVLPSDASGPYHLLAVADAASAVGDVQRANNRVLQTLTIQRPPPVDLQVASVSVPTQSQSGQPMTIGWTTDNAGSGTARDSAWYDAVYLSRDPSLSNGDVQLDAHPQTGPLPGSATVQDSLTADIPLFASGAYYVIVEADTRNDVYEHQAEDNNVAATAVDFTLPPPGDLQVTSINAPTAVTAGDTATVQWTLRNDGPNAVNGTIREGVFVSADSSWDVDDPLLGTVERSVELDSGQTTQASATVNLAKAYKSTADGTVTGPLPGVAPGDYHFIVRTDLTNAIRETANANNGTATPQTTAASMPSLALGDSTSLSLRSGESRYYRVDVPSAGNDLAFTFEGAGQSGSAQLYLRRGEVPTSNTFDVSADAPFMPGQRITLSNAEAGTYYVLARAESLPSEPASFSLSAQPLSFEIQDWSPTHGGNGGVVTVQVEGAQFEPGAQLILQADDGSRIPAQGTVVGSSTKLKGRFILRDQPTGTYDLVVQNPSGAETSATDAFTVEPSQGADPYVETRYPTDVRAGTDVDIEVTVGNRGNENAVDLFLLLGARGYQAQLGASTPTLGIGVVSLSRAKLSPKNQDDEPTPRPVKITDTYPHGDLDLDVDLSVDDTTSLGVTTDEQAVIYPIWFYEIPPDQELTFQLKLSHAIPEGFVLHAGRFVDMPSSTFKRTAAPEDIGTSTGVQLLSNALGTTVQQFNASMAKQSFTASEAEDGVRDMIFDVGNSVSPIGKGAITGAVVGFAAGAALCYASVVCGGAVTLGTVVTIGFQVGGLGAFVGSLYDVMTGSEQAVEEGEGLFDDLFGGLGGNQTNVRASQDPNDILGPDSHGARNWVAADQSLGYTIRFENDPERATAPAQVVEIRHPLDANVDARSFELGPIGFANQTFEVPDNRASYTTRLDVRDSLGVFVDVTAGLDIQAHEAFWRLTSIDPQTGSPPSSDPFAGFLPVNDSTGRGEGFVRYRITPSPDAATGDEIDAEAEIVFDRNAPIETPVVTNTIDADAPQSNLTAVPRTAQDNAFTLTWQGTDTGAGVDRVQLYVAKGDSGRFQPYQSSVRDTSLVFVGEKNETYRFYTRAADFVGNREPSKSVGDTTRALPVELTTFAASMESGAAQLRWATASETNNAGFHVERRISDGPFRHLGFVEGRGTATQPHTYRFRDADLPFEAATIRYRLRQVDVDGTSERFGPVVVKRGTPDRFALHANYPNPAVQQTTLPYELAQPGRVEVRLYDVLGRRVVNAPLGRKTAGRYLHALDVSRLSSGPYFFELRVERDGDTVFREVQKITLVK